MCTFCTVYTFQFLLYCLYFLSLFILFILFYFSPPPLFCQSFCFPCPILHTPPKKSQSSRCNAFRIALTCSAFRQTIRMIQARLRSPQRRPHPEIRQAHGWRQTLLSRLHQAIGVFLPLPLHRTDCYVNPVPSSRGIAEKQVQACHGDCRLRYRANGGVHHIKIARRCHCPCFSQIGCTSACSFMSVFSPKKLSLCHCVSRMR